MRFKKLAMTAVCAAIGISTLPMRAGAQITTFLYDGSKDAGSDAPNSAAEGSWLSFFALGGTPSVVSSGGSTTLDTTTGNTAAPWSTEAGYSNYTASLTPSLVNPLFPTLDPASGFSVSFDVAVNSENNDNAGNRAGFDVIVLGEDHKGVELDFFTNDIFALQYNAPTPPATNGTITRDGGEDTNIQSDSLHDTTALTHYTLAITGTGYTLSTGTSSPLTILTGSTHDYSAYQLPAGVPNPYTLDNYIFIGDDTTEANASATFTDLAVTVVPEPATATGLVAIGLGALARRRRR